MSNKFYMGTYKTVWADGYICNVIFDGFTYRLEGKSNKFKCAKELQEYYRGKIKSWERLDLNDSKRFVTIVLMAHQVVDISDWLQESQDELYQSDEWSDIREEQDECIIALRDQAEALGIL